MFSEIDIILNMQLLPRFHESVPI